MLELSISLKVLNTELEELIVAQLHDIGFEGFWFDNNIIKAYIDEINFNQQTFENFILNASIPIQYSISKLEEKNWNEQWEKSFEPIIIDNKLLIKAPFHTNTLSYPIEIVIQPQMSFGTGHHPTTQLLASYLITKDLKNKIVIDAGCGTGILSILAEKLGAHKIIAFDLEENAFQNAKENIKLNNCSKIEVIYGTIKSISIENANLLLANINRNVLLEEMPYYYTKLIKNGELVLSGFIERDVAILTEKAIECGFVLKEMINLNDWYGLILTK